MSKSTHLKPALASACRAIHPEDLNVGDHVTVLQQSHQIGTFAWCAIDPHQFPPNELVELTVRSEFDALKVRDICFPFLLCTDLDGETRVIDTRSHQIGKLAPSFIRSLKKATKAMQRKQAKKKKSKKRKKRKSKA
ncbi:hypothetical protein N9Y42_02605 [Mariniblastus sp.]|nr:hypothetical protein [Mariniblastus sp.]